MKWDRATSRRENVRSARVEGDPLLHRKLVEFAASPAKAATVELDFEVATLSIIEAGNTEERTVPIAVSARLAGANAGVLLGDCTGPEYQLPEGGQTPPAMLLNCALRLQRGKGDESQLLVQVYGDGRAFVTGQGRIADRG